MSSASKNEAIQPQTKENDASNTKCRTNKREKMRVAGDCSLENTKIIGDNGLLCLTIPHLANAIEDHTKCDQKSVLITCNDRRYGHGNPRQNQRNSPLRMIAQILGFHIKQPPFAEMKVRFYLQQDGSFYQEVLLPQGWFIAPQQHDLKTSSDKSSVFQSEQERQGNDE